MIELSPNTTIREIKVAFPMDCTRILNPEAIKYRDADGIASLARGIGYAYVMSIIGFGYDLENTILEYYDRVNSIINRDGSRIRIFLIRLCATGIIDKDHPLVANGIYDIIEPEIVLHKMVGA